MTEGIIKNILIWPRIKIHKFKLMGFGHRVYKNFDPRAKILKASADKVLLLLGMNDPLLDIAKNLEEAALKDPFFVERKLYPNVDFYSGIIYRAMGIPTNMFTVMFAHRAFARLDCPLERDEGNTRQQNLPPAPDLYWGYQTIVRLYR